MIISESANIINSLGIESKTKYSIEIINEDDFKELEVFLKNNKLPILFLGEGTNIIPPNFFNGVVIRSFCKNINFRKDINILTVDSGVNWHELVKFCISNNINGFENLSLIPGSVGAAPIQNIGAYGADVSYLIKSIEGFDLDAKKLVSISNKDCNFSYRNSSLKNSSILIYSINFICDHPEYINYNYASIKEHIASNHLDIDALSSSIISKIICNIRSKVLPNHELIHNAGSFFKNPIVNSKKINCLKENFNNIPFYKIDENSYKIPAAWLIETSGFKGKDFGNFGVHKTQPLVLVNYGKASGSDINKLSLSIKEVVNKLFKIELETEVNII